MKKIIVSMLIALSLLGSSQKATAAEWEFPIPVVNVLGGEPNTERLTVLLSYQRGNIYHLDGAMVTPSPELEKQLSGNNSWEGCEDNFNINTVRDAALTDWGKMFRNKAYKKMKIRPPKTVLLLDERCPAGNFCGIVVLADPAEELKNCPGRH